MIQREDDSVLINDHKDETEPLLDLKKKNFKPTCLRYYILILFSLNGLIQNIYFNNWSPIADSIEAAMDWGSQGTIVAWLANIAAISYLPGTFFFFFIAYYLDLRSAVVISILLVCLCGVLRCFIFSVSTLYGTIILFIAQFLNGLAGPVAVSATTQLSANWFPPFERNLATAISGQACNLGISLSYIIGPLLVPDVNISSFLSGSSRAELSQSILRLMYIEAAPAVLVFALIVLYFPSRPKSAPSVSSTVERLHLVATLKSYSRNYPLILFSLCYAVPVGVTIGWSGFLYPNLRKLSVHVTQDYVGWLGFYMSTAGVVSAIFFAKIADCFPRRKKLFITAFCFSSGIMFLLFSLLCLDIIKIGDNIYILLTITSILAGIVSSAMDPLIKELIVEVGYPIAEFTSILAASFVSNIIIIIFLGLASLPSLGTSWINWVQTAIYFITTVVVLFTPVRFPRLDQDD